MQSTEELELMECCHTPRDWVTCGQFPRTLARMGENQYPKTKTTDKLVAFRSEL